MLRRSPMWALLGLCMSVSCLTPVATGQLALAWADEFNGTAVDWSSWEALIGNGHAYGIPGWGNNELQYYTSRPENVFVSGGSLHIVARQESYQGYGYTSARLRTLGKRDFLYGRIEARIKMPRGQGIWPALWMLPTGSPYGGWAASGEIDIIETINIPTQVHGTIHFGGQWPANTSNGGSHAPGFDVSSGFHVYAIEWEPDRIRWFFNGVQYHSVTSDQWFSANAPLDPNAPFDTPFHLLLNVAVGGNWPGNPNGTTVFPQEMLVDYVRVYSFGQAPFPGQPHAIPGQIEAEDFDLGLSGEAWSDCDTANQGGAYRDAGVDIEPCAEGGFNVGWMCPGEWLEYTVDVQQAGAYTLEARVASQASGGSFWITTNGQGLTGLMSVPVTGGWQNWVTIQTDVTLGAGEQVLRLTNLGGVQSEYNVQWLRFARKRPTPTPAPAGSVLNPSSVQPIR